LGKSIKYSSKKLVDLIPYVNNSRTHSDEQVAQIAASIQEFGFTNPVLISDDNVLIAGHGRVLAARKLRLKDVPCMVISGLTETQRKALVLADNRLALSAGWDPAMLEIEMKALFEDGYDLSLTGFTEEEIGKFLNQGTEGETDPDEIPEMVDDPISKLGDTWILGNHRLRCGDSTSATDVEALLGGGVSPHLMVTDPPYGVEYDASWREGHDLNIGKGFKGKNARSTGKVMNDDRVDWTEAWALFPGHICYVWHGGLHSGAVQATLEAAGFKMRAQIIWAKQHFVFGRGDYHWQHEPCWYAVKGTGKWEADRKQTTLWQINNNNPFGAGKKEEKVGHSTQKPVECMKRPIENNSSAGQAIYEPFSGSGTTIIAAEMTGRMCYAMELNPVYVDMAVARWEKFTGKKAVLENDRKETRKEKKKTAVQV
jgi:DNA modification methylase